MAKTLSEVVLMSMVCSLPIGFTFDEVLILLFTWTGCK